MRFRLIGESARKRRLHELIDQLGTQELFMRETCAQIVELTDPGDAVHIQVRELLEYLDA